LLKKLKTYEVVFDVDRLQKELDRIEEDLRKEEVWTDIKKLQRLQKQKAEIEDILLPFKKVDDRIKYLKESLNILDEDGGEVFLDEFQNEVAEIKKQIGELELKHLLSDKLDRSNAILEIHPGAGGTESQDWAQILMRMYLRWAERHGFQTKIIDLQYGEEAGIKSATITISGPYAYGYLKSEVGIHRLVRISPFDANKRRHTSFTAVLVYPEIEDDIEIEINEDDLKIDTFRASGAGGQHVNKTSSAVRITHIPTGIVVTCQNERSQHKNRAMAMKILKARLYDLKRREQEEQLENIIGNKKEIAWGNQIRSYVLHPYRMIKDHRTGYETGNVEPVLDGDLDEFIHAYLKKYATKVASF
jgi:peptide chain release factor 2